MECCTDKPGGTADPPSVQEQVIHWHVFCITFGLLAKRVARRHKCSRLVTFHSAPWQRQPCSYTLRLGYRSYLDAGLPGHNSDLFSRNAVARRRKRKGSRCLRLFGQQRRSWWLLGIAVAVLVRLPESELVLAAYWLFNWGSDCLETIELLNVL